MTLQRKRTLRTLASVLSKELFLSGEILRRAPIACHCRSVWRWDCFWAVERGMTNRMWENSAGDGRGPWLSPNSLCLRGAGPYWFQTELGKAWSNDLFLQWENGPCGSWRSACQASYCSESLLSMPDLSWAGHSHIPITHEDLAALRFTQGWIHSPLEVQDNLLAWVTAALLRALMVSYSALIGWQRAKWPWLTHVKPHWVF